MPDDFDVPQDDLEDLIVLEYEAEMEMLRELEEEAAEAAMTSHANESKAKQKEDIPPTQAPSRTQTQSDDASMVSCAFGI